MNHNSKCRRLSIGPISPNTGHCNMSSTLTNRGNNIAGYLYYSIPIGGRNRDAIKIFRAGSYGAFAVFIVFRHAEDNLADRSFSRKKTDNGRVVRQNFFRNRYK